METVMGLRCLDEEGRGSDEGQIRIRNTILSDPTDLLCSAVPHVRKSNRELPAQHVCKKKRMAEM